MVLRSKLTIIFLSALVVGYGVLGEVVERAATRDDPYGELSTFTDVISKVRQDYVEDPDLQEAIFGALHGIMEVLDPYCSFVHGKIFQEVEQKIDTAVASPGILLTKRYGYTAVVSVRPSSPAEREGLRTGDLVVTIDGKTTRRMSLWEAQHRLMGPADTEVSLNVVRHRNQISEITLTKEVTPPAEVLARILEDGIGLLKISHFGAGVAASVRSHLKMLAASDVTGLVIDLRGNAEGDLSEAIQASDLFLEPGKTVVSVGDRDGKLIHHLALDEPMVRAKSIVILINAGTSGPAEVFTAALRDHGLAATVGERTNGYGSEQERFALEDGSMLLLTTRLYYRSSEKLLQQRSLARSGIAPDLRSPSENFVTNFYYEKEPEDLEKSPDEEFYRQLDKAIDEEQLKTAVEQVRVELVREAA